MSASDNLPLRTLLRVVHHRQPENEPGIAAVLKLAGLSTTLQRSLDDLLHRLGLNDRSFAVLVALDALDPEPMTPADLAYHIDAHRPSVALTLIELVHSGHVVRQQDADRRGATRIGLTPAGRELTRQAVHLFLEAARRISRDLDPAACALVTMVCDTIHAECHAAAPAALADAPFLP